MADVTEDLRSTDQASDPNSATHPTGSDTNSTITPKESAGLATITEDVEVVTIRHDIEHTRHDISATLDAIKEKLSPPVLMEQAKEKVQEVTADALDQAKSHLREAAIEATDHAKDAVAGAVSNTINEVKDSVGDAVHTASDVVSNVVHTVQDKVSHVIGSAHDTVGDATHSAQSRMGNVMEGAKGAGTTIADTVRRHPLPTALAALGAGYLYLKHRDDNKMPRYSVRDYDYTDFDPLFPPAVTPMNPEFDVADRVEATGEPRPMSSSDRNTNIEDIDDVSNASHRNRDAVGGIARTMSSDANGTSLLDTMQRNPLPLALAVGGLAWLYLKNLDDNRPTRGVAHDYSDYLTPAPGLQDAASDTQHSVVDTVKDKASQVSDTVKDKASQVSDTVSGAVSTAKDKVGGAVGSARDAVTSVTSQASKATAQATKSVSNLGSQALEQTRSMGGAAADTFHKNPLPIALIALGLGAAAGLLIPTTEPENRVMGQTRDRLFDQAQSRASDIAQKVQTVAEHTLETAKNTATEEAKNQGLTGE